MSSHWCEKCGEYMMLRVECGCEPVLAQIVDYHSEDDWDEHHARYLPKLAEKVAEEYWEQDPHDPINFDLKVRLKDKKDVIRTYQISAEAVVNFSATEINVQPSTATSKET